MWPDELLANDDNIETCVLYKGNCDWYCMEGPPLRARLALARRHTCSSRIEEICSDSAERKYLTCQAGMLPRAVLHAVPGACAIQGCWRKPSRPRSAAAAFWELCTS